MKPSTIFWIVFGLVAAGIFTKNAPPFFWMFGAFFVFMYFKNKDKEKEKEQKGKKGAWQEPSPRQSSGVPPETKPINVIPDKVTNPHKELGIARFKEFDYQGAVESFCKSLEIQPHDVATHFNLACSYSLLENAPKAMFHLQRSVELGFKDFERIQHHDALAFLRIQESWKDFEAKGYRLQIPESTPKTGGGTPDLLEQIKMLAELRDKGALTEEEFQDQKRKLLA
jgi:tetratricopeptide (TPR) repeat protein